MSRRCIRNPSSVPMSNTSCAAATAWAKAWGSRPRLPRWKMRAQTPFQQGLIVPPESRGNTALGAASHTPSQARPTEPFLGSILSQQIQPQQIPAFTPLLSRAAGALHCSSRAELPRSRSRGAEHPTEQGPWAVPDANNLHSLCLRCLQQVPAGFQRGPEGHARVGRRDGVSSDPQQHPAQQSHTVLSWNHRIMKGKALEGWESPQRSLSPNINPDS